MAIPRAILNLHVNLHVNLRVNLRVNLSVNLSVNSRAMALDINRIKANRLHPQK